MARAYSYRYALETWLRQRRIPLVLFYYIATNVLVYILASLLTVGSQFASPDASASILQNIVLPSNLSYLILRPWTLVTHFFYHQSFTHLLFNMLWLWVFGRMFFQYFTARQFHFVYWLGGLTGGIAYIWAYNFFDYFSALVPVSVALGASAAIMAITLTTVVVAPNNLVYLFGLFRVRIVWLAVGMVLLDFMSITQSNAGGHIAHLGGALIGSLYAYLTHYTTIKKQNPLYSFKDKINALFSSLKNKHTSQSKQTSHARNNSKKEEEKELERILAKLAKGGYASLSREEKEKLFRRR